MMKNTGLSCSISSFWNILISHLKNKYNVLKVRREWASKRERDREDMQTVMVWRKVPSAALVDYQQIIYIS